jgi:hypothetical protein
MTDAVHEEIHEMASWLQLTPTVLT